jgi:hypothetical protein
MGDTLTCCERATDAELEEDPDAYDCETCELAQQRATLASADLDALQLYPLLALPVVQDLHLLPLVFDVVDVQVTRAEGRALLARLQVIHADRAPAAAPQEETDPDG